MTRTRESTPVTQRQIIRCATAGLMALALAACTSRGAQLADPKAVSASEKGFCAAASMPHATDAEFEVMAAATQSAWHNMIAAAKGKGVTGKHGTLTTAAYNLSAATSLEQLRRRFPALPAPTLAAVPSFDEALGAALAACRGR